MLLTQNKGTLKRGYAIVQDAMIDGDTFPESWSIRFARQYSFLPACNDKLTYRVLQFEIISVSAAV